MKKINIEKKEKKKNQESAARTRKESAKGLFINLFLVSGKDMSPTAFRFEFLGSDPNPACQGNARISKIQVKYDIFID